MTATFADNFLHQSVAPHSASMQKLLGVVFLVLVEVAIGTADALREHAECDRSVGQCPVLLGQQSPFISGSDHQVEHLAGAQVFFTTLVGDGHSKPRRSPFPGCCSGFVLQPFLRRDGKVRMHEADKCIHTDVDH